MLTSRQLVILKTIIEEFIATAEPVGSKTLMNLLDITCSSATLRNEMAVLEDEGLLVKTHTSSGRIPSAKGYRFYVENLMDNHLDEGVANALTTIYQDRNYSLEEIIKKSCDILSDMTSLTSVVLGPESSYHTLSHIKLFQISDRSAVAVFITSNGHTESKTFNFDTDITINDIETCTDVLNEQLVGTPINMIVDKMEDIRPLLETKISRHEVLFQCFVSAFVKFASDSIYCSGKNNMLYQPEFTDINKLKKLMVMLEDSSLWRELNSQYASNVVRIGTSDLVTFDDLAVVSSTIRFNGKDEGQLMVVGPQRMQYEKVINLIEFMSKSIEEMFNE